MDDPLAVAHLLAEAAFDAWIGIEDTRDLGATVGQGADGTPTTRADAILEAAVLD